MIIHIPHHWFLFFDFSNENETDKKWFFHLSLINFNAKKT